jgi:hypothetical protein
MQFVIKFLTPLASLSLKLRGTGRSQDRSGAISGLFRYNRPQISGSGLNN